MEIVKNSDGILTMSCMDRAYDVGNKVEWEINSKVVQNDDSTESESCIALNWRNELKLGQSNTVICRVKRHPGQPKWQEIRGWVYVENQEEFRLSGNLQSPPTSPPRTVPPQRRTTNGELIHPHFSKFQLSNISYAYS